MLPRNRRTQRVKKRQTFDSVEQRQVGGVLATAAENYRRRARDALRLLQLRSERLPVREGAVAAVPKL